MGDSCIAGATGKLDLQMLHDLRFDYPKNLLCGYLNTNSLRNKIHDSTLTIDKHGEGLIEFVRKGLICKRLRKYESINIDVICSELTISNRNWVIFIIYRPPD